MSTATDAINNLQRRILAGEEPPLDEIAAAIKALRTERTGVSAARAEKAEKAQAVATIDIAALFAPKEPSNG